MLLRREGAFLVIAVLLALAAGSIFYFSRATTLTIAVAPSGGTEPVLLKAFADALAAKHQSIRLKILAFDGVRESAEALQAGRADLAVVRPDIAMPEGGLTLAILRDQAVIVVSPEPSGISAFADLARKRLGILVQRGADRSLIEGLIEYYGLTPVAESPNELVQATGVSLVPVEEADLAKALADKRVDAIAMVTTPTTPAATRIVGIVQMASRSRKISIFGAPDAASIVERFPRLQAVTVTAGVFGGGPKLPDDDVPSVGVTYRLMARANLSRSVAAAITEQLFEMRTSLSDKVPAANYIHPPSYDSTLAATSARLPIHPGAIDYFEREQESFIERYETWIYLVAFLGGGLGSAVAWLRQRLSRLRREHIEVATDRLLEIQSEARDMTDRAKLNILAAEIDDVAAGVVRYVLHKPTEPRTISAAAMAVDAARSTVTRAAGVGTTRSIPAHQPDLRVIE